MGAEMVVLERVLQIKVVNNIVYPPLMTAKDEPITVPKKVLRLAKKHFVTVVFPVFCFGAIYKDYNQTVKYKAQKAAEQSTKE
jgi:hypothetical protein